MILMEEKLRILTYVLIFIIGLIIGAIGMIFRCGFRVEKEIKEKNFYISYNELFNLWLYIELNNISFKNYFKKNGFHRIAIYGIGKLGVHLKREIERNGYEVAYIVDDGEKAFYTYRIYSSRDNLPEADVIVVTPFLEYELIKKKISEKNNINIISLKEVLEKVNED